MQPFVVIKEIRLQQKLTQSQLAKLVPMAQGYLSELESNKKSPTLRQICKIAEALNVNPSELFYFSS